MALVEYTDTLIGFGGGSWADEVEDTYGKLTPITTFSTLG